MSWEEILKIDAPDNMRGRMIEEAEMKTNNLVERVMRGIDTLEEQTVYPSEIASGEDLEELEREYAVAYVYDTMFGRVSLTVTMDGRLENGYYEGRTIATMDDAAKANKEMLRAQKREYAGKTKRSQIGYAETPDEHYYN